MFVDAKILTMSDLQLKGKKTDIYLKKNEETAEPTSGHTVLAL